MAKQIRVWDGPLRLFHWLLVLSVVTALYTGWLGGSWMGWHERAGLMIIGLLSFRMAWFVLGSTYARLSTLLCSLLALPQYLRGEWRGAGHNPLGVLSVFVMLAMLTWQAVSGLFTNDDIAFTGPLYRLVSSSLSNDLTRLHKLGMWIIIVLIMLHVLAIIIHAAVKQHNLVKPMLTGTTKQEYPEQKPARGGHGLAFVFALLIAVGGVYLAAGDWQPKPPPAPAVTPAW
ncbi:cytochrome b/b6 domain-containing protein [Denitrificimonas sp. JX-1]|uniref:Cytochrome b/b6 domain-containing protein n=1 Tax=Denitrificimonas halotolerans TaxID=3098930 RepID=A0ABU5GS01_9GAMM|nr:cytochrome b/b6 domain-containing protein [Denitrificimonas sp. JX-1]MDY7219771.1 cytochrome b/b6 domain-containing protein [Denitrificimonas sp. JX-1]